MPMSVELTDSANLANSDDLTSLTTFRTTARAARILTLSNTEQLSDLAEQLRDTDFIVLGSGSNVLFADDYAGTVVLNRLRGIELIKETADDVLVRLASGEIWHDSVLTLSQRGFYGLENLALIPGTAGAAPVQNIGAYGVEIADLIESISVFDLQHNTDKTLPAEACQFAYRDSVFKQSDYRKRYVITAMTLRLSKTFTPNLSYRGLLAEGEEPPQSADALLARVIAVRRSKLPDPDKLPNAGSFFKNPIVSKETLDALRQRYPNLPAFPIATATDTETNDAFAKIPAAWLLEQIGFKGITRSNGAGVYDKHALILVNHGHAHGSEIYALACDMMTSVAQRFGITLHPEVRIIGANRE